MIEVLQGEFQSLLIQGCVVWREIPQEESENPRFNPFLFRGVLSALDLVNELRVSGFNPFLFRGVLSEE